MRAPGLPRSSARRLRRGSCAEPLVPAPQGAPLLLEVMADGVQVYSCEPKGQGFEWTFKAPEANLFDQQGVQIGAHFAGPTWKFEQRHDHR